MNYIDVLLVVVLVLPIYSAWERGFLFTTADLISWLGSLVLAFYTNAQASRFIEQLFPGVVIWSRPFAFIFTAVAVKLLLDWIVGHLFRYIPPHVHASLVNRSLGLLPGLVNGALCAAFVATLLLLLPLNSKVPMQVRESRIARPLITEIDWLGKQLAGIFSGGNDFTKHPPHVNAEETIKLPFKVSDPVPNPTLEQEMLVLMNKERKLMGLKPLVADPEMRVVARKHAADMFARGYFSHRSPEGKDPFDRMAAEQVSFLTAGENLALAQSLEIAHDGLMKSPGHRANILNGAFGRVGIGIQDGGFYGLMITQNFRD